MDTKMIIELVGYVGSFLVLISMLMTSMVKLRVINMIGSIIFTIYALIIRSYPTAFMNACLVIINIYHLVNLRRTVNTFNLLELGGKEDFLNFLLETYGKDIQKFFPSFDAKAAFDRAFLILNNTNVAGIFLCTNEEDKSVTALLDYTTPAYRDTSAGQFLYETLPFYEIRQIQVPDASPEHAAYLEKVGFAKEQGRYVRNL